MANVEFNIKVQMNERWVDDFCSMLKHMESYGNMGHSALIGFYADGDGDFRPKFEIDREFNSTKGFTNVDTIPDIVFDAG